MKIGRFAVENNLSIDTIRHYMDLGLIIPEKKGGHYYYDDRCKNDLKDILSLKGMGFTLNEIKSIFLFRRLGKQLKYQEDKYLKELLIAKLKQIKKQINELINIESKLESKIEELSSNEYSEQLEMGVNIRTLRLFKCLKCNNELTLFADQISNNQIINGKLICKCGEEYLIDDGILFVNSKFSKNDNMFDFNYLIDYLNVTDPGYLDNLNRGLEWIYKKINFSEFKSKVILDLGSGMGFFLRHIYNDLPDDSLYIAVDHDIRRHKFLKNVLENADHQKNIIFLCSDFLELPLKNKTVDILLDHSGTSNYSFEHEKFLLKLIDNYIKDDALLLGGFILFKNFSINSLIDGKFRKNYILDNIKEEIKELKYKLIDERTSNFLSQGGKYESYFKEDEKVYTYGFYGKRLG